MEQSLLIAVTMDELKTLIKSAVKEAVREDTKENKNGSENMDEVLDVKQAASYLKLKVATLYEKTCKRLIPHFKKGKKLYFKTQELESWLKEGKVMMQSDLQTQAANYCLQNPRTKKSWKKIKNDTK